MNVLAINVKEAKKLSKEASEPTTVGQVFTQIRKFAKLGFDSTTVLIPKKNKSFKVLLVAGMKENGFEVWEDCFDDEKYCITIEWA